MSTSNAQAKLDYIAGTKTAIKDAIELKGVTVGAATFREYADKIGEISTGGTWQPQPEWIDISTVGDNEINLLVTEGTGIAFSTTVAGAGTYTIDWGDGTVETSRASGTIYMHQHIANGTAWGATYTWKIRIYGATGDITGWKVERHTYTTRKQYHPILWAVFGTMGMTTYANAFYNTTVNCVDLQSCVIPTFASVSNTSYMFFSCYSLKYINNIDYLGSISVACDFTNFAKDCEFLQTTTTIASLISKIGIYGASGYKLKVTSIRLTNASSTFGGSSPQVNVSYTDLDATALNTLFGDLPTLTGKTIVITGCTGAATCDTSIATGKGWTVTN